jgi:hypothetical protein
MSVVIAASVTLLLIFVKRTQIRAAFLAFMLAQLFSWPITLFYVRFGLQTNPVRLFSHATESNFLFAFVFHPSVFAVYYLHYPKKARKSLRLIYSALLVAAPIFFQFAASKLTNLIEFKSALVPVASFAVIFILYNISRLYMVRYLSKLKSPWGNER